MEISANQNQITRASMIQRPSIHYERRLSVMGEQLLFQTNHMPFIEATELTFGRFPPANQTTYHPITLQLFIHSPEELNNQKLTLTAHSHGNLLNLSAGKDNFVVADLQRGFAFGYITQSLAQDLEYIRYAFIESAVQAMLGLNRGFVAIHAAAVVKYDICLLLCGPSGTGKSTLAYACLHNGYKLLSEDVVQAKVSGKRLQLWGMPWKCHLLAESLQFFPDIKGKKEKLLVNGKWKVPLDLAETHPQSMMTNAQNGRLIFLRKPQPNLPAMLTPLSPAETRANFEAIWSWEGGWQPQYEQRLNDLLDAGAYHLQLGLTPDESIQALEKVFDFESLSENSTLRLNGREQN